MRFRVGILDFAAAAVVVIAILLPGRSAEVTEGYAKTPQGEAVLPEQASRVAELQAAHAASPHRGDIAAEYGNTLLLLGHHDEALRVVSQAVAATDVRTKWMVYRQLAEIRSERLEIRKADQAIKQALAACDQAQSNCAGHDAVRVDMFARELALGVQAVDDGVDPHLDLAEYRRRTSAAHPTVRTRGGK